MCERVAWEKFIFMFSPIQRVGVKRTGEKNPINIFDFAINMTFTKYPDEKCLIFSWVENIDILLL